MCNVCICSYQSVGNEELNYVLINACTHDFHLRSHVCWQLIIHGRSDQPCLFNNPGIVNVGIREKGLRGSLDLEWPFLMIPPGTSVWSLQAFNTVRNKILVVHNFHGLKSFTIAAQNKWRQICINCLYGIPVFFTKFQWPSWFHHHNPPDRAVIRHPRALLFCSYNP